jgi:hypothetical protein
MKKIFQVIVEVVLFIEFIRGQNFQNSTETEINKFFKQRLQIHLQEVKHKSIESLEKFSNPIFENYKESIKKKIMNGVFKDIENKNRTGLNILNFFQKKLKSKSFSFLEKFKKLNRPFPVKDEPSKFFNIKFDININKLPLKGETKQHNWSGSYWPMRNGLISVRYGNNEKNTIGRWDSNTLTFTEKYNYRTSVLMYSQPNEYNSHMQFNRSSIESQIEESYSPSEKYDLYMGDYSFSLTNYIKNDAHNHASQYGGDIPTWFGICHGWAPAAYFFNEPKRPVSVKSPNGIKIRFLPDDLKALSSQFLAVAHHNTNFIGDVCRIYKPKKPVSDSETKLWLDPKCHAINPGSYIITLGNQIGKLGKNMVFDPESDPEIWNQPINSYIMRYFNLLTDDFSADPQEVKIPIKFIQKSKDGFLNYVARQSDYRTKYIVGVYVNVTYAIENDPSHTERSPANVNKTVESVAAIELDGNDEIIGGEWKHNLHPNFMWKFDENHPVESCCDEGVKNFAGNVNEEVTKWAVMASQRGHILRPIIDYLINESTKNKTVDLEQELKNRWNFLFNN